MRTPLTVPVADGREDVVDDGVLDAAVVGIAIG
jgi:hypothetical protein